MKEHGVAEGRRVHMRLCPCRKGGTGVWTFLRGGTSYYVLIVVGGQFGVGRRGKGREAKVPSEVGS